MVDAVAPTPSPRDRHHRYRRPRHRVRGAHALLATAVAIACVACLQPTATAMTQQHRDDHHHLRGQRSANANANFNANANATTTTARAMHELCGSFLAVSDFVLAHCDIGPETTTTPTDGRCMEAFGLFDASPALLLECEHRAPDPTTKARMLGFLTRYARFQLHEGCRGFHEKEARAAALCSRDAATSPGGRRAWHPIAPPRFCEAIFRVYRENRREIDTNCPRTRHSDAFWEAYADDGASPLCKRYYARLRAAVDGGCGGDLADPSVLTTRTVAAVAMTTTAADDDDEPGETPPGTCAQVFAWYAAHQRRIERECLEIRGARPFYRGFYAWKRSGLGG